ncbi:hypothetical protein G3M58_50295, partial [Streptomyces sp. SID7499]|nr:hypothetical protein [Streptomyces sp. SID7499]
MTRADTSDPSAAPPPPARRDLRSAIAPGAVGAVLVLAAAVLLVTLPGKLAEAHD